MKEKLLTLAVALLAATGAWAQTFTFDNLKYTVTNAEAKTVELTGYVTAPEGALTIPATVTNESTEYSVTSIGSMAFFDCASLTAVTIPEGVATIRSRAFLRSALTQVTLPEGLTNISNMSFEGCAALAQINLPNSLTSIAERAFYGCTSLTEVTLPDGLTKIELFTFYGCSALEKVTLPEGITYIGDKAFYKCSGLTEMTVLATTPPTVGTDVFLNVSRTIPVYVPAASLATYQAAAVWNEFNLMPESIRIYNGTLHNPQQLHLTLYDMQGRQVYSGTDATLSQPAGVYVVRCNGASGKVLF